MHSTRIDITEKKRQHIVNILNQHLSSALDLSMQAKQAHWNVKSPNFKSLHELFDALYEAINAGIDDLAERIVQLGGQAEGTAQVVTKKTYLKPLSVSLYKGDALLVALADNVALYGKFIRKSIDDVGDFKDADTADLLTEISREVDKYLWMLESHL